MNPIRSRLGVFALLACFGMALLNGCIPPRRVLSQEDKVTDMYWLFSQFNENYAPLEYKEGRLGFKYEELKQKYLEMAKATQNNEDFYKVMYQFVSEFQDAHTSASVNTAQLPGRAKVAYLGFMGVRKADKFLVKEFFPSVERDAANFPVKVGDVISKIDGEDLKAVVQREILPYRNIGQEESNLTFGMGRLFARLSTGNGMPKAAEAKLTVIRGDKEVEIVLPWIVKDLVDFSGEQRRATQEKKGAAAEVAALGFDPADLFKIGMISMNGRVENLTSAISKIVQNLPSYNFWKSFTFIDTSPAWFNGVKGVNPKASGETFLKANRNIPEGALVLEESRTFPMYVTRENVLNAKGEATGTKKMVAYIFLYSFSPPVLDESAVIAEWTAVFKKLNALGVQDLVIDMINNGGGSLVLGMKLAQFLSPSKVVMPDIQYRLSETWLDNFEEISLAEEKNDAEREINRRIYNMMLDDKKDGKRLSRRFNTESLITFPLSPNAALAGNKLNIVLLVNEMCASMCDIFTAILKDNNMAKVVGSKTMGAGGNVVNHMMAPNSALNVRQTESLILRADGTYIENNGIEPDVAVKVNESAESKYDDVRSQAMKLLLTEAPAASGIAPAAHIAVK